MDREKYSSAQLNTKLLLGHSQHALTCCQWKHKNWLELVEMSSVGCATLSMAKVSCEINNFHVVQIVSIFILHLHFFNQFIHILVMSNQCVPVVLFLSVLVLVLLILTLKRHRKGQRIAEDEEDMRDNVIKYNDEGGGEQDTQAYDMSALRNLYDFPEAKSCDSGPDIRSLPQWIQANRVTGGGGGAGAEGAAATAAAVATDFSLFKGYIRKKVEQADADLSVPPYDSFQTYAFEGTSSPALSLSSIHTLSTTSEQDFSYLSDWGPRFRQLAGYYAPGKQEEEGS